MTSSSSSTGQYFMIFLKRNIASPFWGSGWCPETQPSRYYVCVCLSLCLRPTEGLYTHPSPVYKRSTRALTAASPFLHPQTCKCLYSQTTKFQNSKSKRKKRTEREGGLGKRIERSSSSLVLSTLSRQTGLLVCCVSTTHRCVLLQRCRHTQCRDGQTDGRVYPCVF